MYPTTPETNDGAGGWITDSLARKEKLDAIPIADWTGKKSAKEAFGIKNRDEIAYLNGQKFLTTPVYRRFTSVFIKFVHDPEFIGVDFEIGHRLWMLKKMMEKAIAEGKKVDYTEQDLKEWFRGTNAATPVIAREMQLANPEFADRIKTRRCPLGNKFYPNHPWDYKAMEDDEFTSRSV